MADTASGSYAMFRLVSGTHGARSARYVTVAIMSAADVAAWIRKNGGPDARAILFRPL